MEKLKTRVLGMLAIFVVLIGMAGIVSAAPPCGGNAVFSPQGIGSVGTSISGTVVTYNVAAADTIIGLCVEETDRTNITHTGLSDPQSPDFWKFSHPDGMNHFSYERTGSQISLLATQNRNVGQADFHNNPLPTAEIYALHVNDSVLCSNLSRQKTSTCWIAPGSGTVPTPEVDTIFLTASGLLGLVVVTRKYKNK